MRKVQRDLWSEANSLCSRNSPRERQRVLSGCVEPPNPREARQELGAVSVSARTAFFAVPTSTAVTPGSWGSPKQNVGTFWVCCESEKMP